MKLINHIPDIAYNITGHGPGFIMVNKEKHEHSLLISPQCFESLILDRIQDLTEEHLSYLLTWQPKIVLLGTGSQLIFPQVSLLRPLIAQQIGFEVMDTPAACRTYNVLASEDRPVVALLITETAASI